MKELTVIFGCCEYDEKQDKFWHEDREMVFTSEDSPKKTEAVPNVLFSGQHGIHTVLDVSTGVQTITSQVQSWRYY